MATSKFHLWGCNNFISPRNSKWLSENLQETDRLVNEMLKLIEEDGDSFAKKAQMYYQRRPELISHVGDFYRMYRSLAERYDHAINDMTKNISNEIQSQGSVNCSEFGTEVASISIPSSPDITSESSFDYDNGKVLDDYENSSKLEDRIIELEQELFAARVKLHKCKNGHKEQCEDLVNNEQQDFSSKTSFFGNQPVNNMLGLVLKKFAQNNSSPYTEYESYDSKLKFFEERVKQLEAEKSKACLESEKQISELNQSLYNCKMKVDMLTLEKDELNAEVIRLIEDIETWDEESSKIDEQLRELRIEHEKLIQEVEDARKASAEHTNRVMELEEEVEIQRGVIIDCAEGKREAIRHLCFSLEHYRDGYQQLKQILIMKANGFCDEEKEGTKLIQIMDKV